MVLSAYECSVVTELLSGLTEGDRIQLAKTVSKKIIKVVNADKALNVILLHSPSVESILTRKKISKQLLFNYLHYKQVPVEPAFSKEELIKRLLDHWEENIIKWNPETTYEYTDHIENPEQYEINHSGSESSYDYVENPSELVPQLQEVRTTLNYEPSVSSQGLVPQSQELHPGHQSPINHDTQLIASNVNVEELGTEFTKWFNIKFNSCNATSGYAFDSAMFFANATAEFRIIRNINGQETVDNSSVIESNHLIGQTFSELQRVYNLYLNMNLDALKVTRNSYGNILIGSCGSLHSASQLVGVYEQLVQLFHDPLCTLSDKPVWKVQKLLFNCKFANSYREIESGQPSESSGMAELEYDVSYDNS